MGKEVVYCSGCGRRLREDDFTEGRGFEILNRVACADCKERVVAELAPGEREEYLQKTEPKTLKRPASGLVPAQKKPTEPPSRAPSSGRFRREGRAGTSKRLPAAPMSPEAGQKKSNMLLYIIAAVVGGGILILLLVLATRKTDRPGIPPGPGGGSDPSHQQRTREAAADKRYEEFLSAVQEKPERIDEHLKEAARLRPDLSGTPAEGRLNSVERELQGLLSAKEARLVAVGELLDQVRRISDEFRRFERNDEIRRLLFDAENQASDPVTFGRFSIRVEGLKQEVANTLQKYEFAQGGRAEAEAKRVSALIDNHLKAREYYQALDAIAEFGRQYKDHATYAELRSLAGRIRQDQLKIGQWIDVTDQSRWIRIKQRGSSARAWANDGDALSGQSSFAAGAAYGDSILLDEEFRDFELAFDVEGDRADSLEVAVRVDAGAGGIKRPGARLNPGKASGSLLITVEGSSLSGAGSEFNLDSSVPTAGKVLLSIRNGSKLKIRQIRIKRLR